MSDDFYSAFEGKYRGSRELIKSRLRVYLPFLEPLIDFYPEANALDLGCGRGEWLELMAEIGFKPYGVDLDEGMLSSCFERGLPVEQGDAVEFLAALPDESQAVVSAFHMVEHIRFDQLQTVVSEAQRVLKPGGLLILETPNPENLVVATRNFYLDPTHLRPIPPELLSFLPEHYGFGRVKILRLQESAELSGGRTLTLLDILNGVSPDYAVVAQKDAPKDLLSRFDAVFGEPHGLSLETLAKRYDAQIATVETVSEKAAAEAAAEVKIQQLLSQLNAAQMQLGEKSVALTRREAALTEEQARNRQLESERNADRLKIVELNQTLRELVARRQELQIANEKAENLSQQLQTELNAARMQAEGLNAQLAEKTATLASREATLAEQQVYARRLEKESGEAKEKLDELNREFKETLVQRYEAQAATVEAEARIQQLQVELVGKVELLEACAKTLTEQQAHSQQLQRELNAARTSAEDLNAQWNETRAALVNCESALGDEQARSQWLDNEWNAAKAKIAELNQISHHWWTESTRLSHELQSVYHSKSWRITWPLRKLTQFCKWLFFLPIRFIRWLVRLPKRAIRWVVVKAIAFVLRHPGLKVRAKDWLNRHPQMDRRIRRFAEERGLVNAPWACSSGSFPPASTEQDRRTAGAESAVFEPDLSHLTPRARQIYMKLKDVRKNRRKEVR